LMSDKTLGTQVDEDSVFYERFEDFEKESGYVNRSAAIRALMRDGLDQFEEEQDREKPNRLAELQEHLDYMLRRSAEVWMWGLSFVVVALAVVTFNELHQAGMLSEAQVQGLRPALFIVVGVGMVGMTARFVTMGVGVAAAIVERGEAE
jgi:hypothetical protein